MSRNGQLFISVVSAADFTPSVWDPHAYRRRPDQKLSQFADVYKITSKHHPHRPSPFRPDEYRSIPGGGYLSFAITPIREDETAQYSKLPSVSEGAILFGTMRAYLGNVIVTPLAPWRGREPPLYFLVKSEFALVRPRDG